MATLLDIKNDIKALRGSEVRIFGQPTVLSNTVDEFTIDVLDVLDALDDYEVEFDGDEINELGLTEISADNTYNWNAPISNDIAYVVYKSCITGYIYVKLMVHRYGDVRANYTGIALLQFDNEDCFLMAMGEVTKTVYTEIDGVEYYSDFTIFDDGLEVYSGDTGEYVTHTCACDMKEFINDIKEAL